jgi:hypothetical protein
MDIAALKASALKATPGPWTVGGTGPWICTIGNNHDDPAIFGARPADGQPFQFGDKRDDAGFIALANPTSILSLIARLEALEEALSFHVRNCPLCRGKRKAISAWDLLTKDNPEETECERCAPGWALLSTEPVQS